MFLLDMQNYLLPQEQATAGRIFLHVATTTKKKNRSLLFSNITLPSWHMGESPNQAIRPVLLTKQLDTEERIETAKRKRDINNSSSHLETTSTEESVFGEIKFIGESRNYAI